MTSQTIEQTTIRPCPLWCRLAPGHRWDSIHDDGRRSRATTDPTSGRTCRPGPTSSQKLAQSSV